MHEPIQKLPTSLLLRLPLLLSPAKAGRDRLQVRKLHLQAPILRRRLAQDPLDLPLNASKQNAQTLIIATGVHFRTNNVPLAVLWQNDVEFADEAVFRTAGAVHDDFEVAEARSVACDPIADHAVDLEHADVIGIHAGHCGLRVNDVAGPDGHIDLIDGRRKSNALTADQLAYLEQWLRSEAVDCTAIESFENVGVLHSLREDESAARSCIGMSNTYNVAAELSWES